MSFTFVTADDGGRLYAVMNNGHLLFYRDDARDGTSRWAFDGAGQEIGSGWDEFLHVFSGGDGIIYAVTSAGHLLYYRDEARNGTSQWAFDGVGQDLGTGWNSFWTVFSGGDGIIYAITYAGDLLYYRDLARDGTTNWAFGGEGQAIGRDWGNFVHVFPGGDGIIYAVTPTGDLLFYRDEARDGTARWSFNGVGQQIGRKGWSGFWTACPGGDGTIYAITPTGTLFYYRDEARDGRSQWACGGVGQIIGHGWDTAVLEGYCWPLSASPGEAIEFQVAAPSGCQVDFLRLDRTAHGSVGTLTGLSESVPQTLQVADPEWPIAGCGWSTSFTLSVPPEWASGLYAARCTDPSGSPFHIVFVVKPMAERRGRVLALASTNTWNAYNQWGGYSKYGPATPNVLTFLRPNHATTPVDDGHINHLTRADLWILHWLEEAGYRPDVISDADFHAGFPDLASYQVLILLTHPEYWTLEMLDQLEVFLAGGGSVLYLGGNGVFEHCSYGRGMESLVFFNGDPAKNRDAAFLRNLSPARPERELLGVAFRFENSWGADPATYKACPYVVLAADHALFAGTQLENGDLVGERGRQGIEGGGASGWEMDTSNAGDHDDDGVLVRAMVGSDRGAPPANLQLLARGNNAADHSADMTYYDTGHGGFVFSVGSICFGGSLVEDPQLQRIVSNALAASLA